MSNMRKLIDIVKESSIVDKGLRAPSQEVLTESIEEANRNQDTTWRDEAEQEMRLDPGAPYYVGWSEQAYDEETGRPKGDAGGVYAINIDNVVDAQNLVQELGAGYYYESMKDMHPSDISYMRYSKDKINDYSKQDIGEGAGDSGEQEYEISVDRHLSFEDKAAISTELNQHKIGVWGTDHDPETDSVVFKIQTNTAGLKTAKELISKYVLSHYGENVRVSVQFEEDEDEVEIFIDVSNLCRGLSKITREVFEKLKGVTEPSVDSDELSSLDFLSKENKRYSEIFQNIKAGEWDETHLSDALRTVLDGNTLLKRLETNLKASSVDETSKNMLVKQIDSMKKQCSYLFYKVKNYPVPEKDYDRYYDPEDRRY